MGYALAGYPTKRHKRKKHVHHDEMVTYYDEKPLKITKIKRRKKQLPEMKVFKRFGLQDLPVEVLQEIFVYTEEPSSMFMLNKFFYKCLFPTRTLRLEVIWQKYGVPGDLMNRIFDMFKDKLPERVQGKSMIKESYFKHTDRIIFFLENIEHFNSRISYILPETYEKAIEASEIENLVLNDESPVTVKYEILIREKIMPLLFKNNGLFLESAKLFDMSGTDLKIPIIWFFDQKEFTISSLYSFLDDLHSSIREPKKTFDSYLLVEIIELIFNSNIPIDRMEFLLEANAESLERIKLDIIEGLMVRFWLPAQISNANDQGNDIDGHSDNDGVLSSPILWEALKVISSIELIDIVEKHGGKPHYHIMT